MAKIAILGFGTVGSGVAEAITKNAEIIQNKLSEKIELKYILDIREFPNNPFSEKIIKDFSIIQNDPEIEVVVETIGGAKIAYEFTKKALLSGKHVVTSNKELVATHGEELLRIAREKNVNYFFEASVGGTIPILTPLESCLGANKIEEIYGILNGTTNYILTRMIKANLSFEDALKEAQALGYAEQDPTADIEGHDACRKICILADLAYGKNISPEKVQTEGISNITLDDVTIAEAGRYVIKLLGRVKMREDGKIFILVAPHLIKNDHPLAVVNDVFNGILVRGNICEEVMFYGKGAGKLPTASAVIADVIDAVRHREKRKDYGWSGSGDDMVADLSEMVYSMYYRISDRHSGDCKAISEIYDHKCLSLEGAPDGEYAFVTKPMSGKEHEEKAALLQKKFPILSRIRVLDDQRESV
ncbi:MAG: homoserine dehydrogenase [Clostridiales bacterium]|nr:homoserine dehydrogenase [Clostridiales bacterium]